VFVVKVYNYSIIGNFQKILNYQENETPSPAAPPPPIINKPNTPVKFTKNTLLNNKRKTPTTENEEFPKSNKRKKHVSR
jgi:hypothetical protein